jgi:hypothetical protein
MPIVAIVPAGVSVAIAPLSVLMVPDVSVFITPDVSGPSAGAVVSD